MNYLHENNLIHRDLKLENILLDENLNPKLCDFGWSTITDEQWSTFCGTLEYIAPEMFENQKYSFSVDIWGLGIILYELFHKKSPFKDDNAFKIYKNILTQLI